MITLTTTMIAAIATFDPKASKRHSDDYDEGPRCVVCGDEYTYDFGKSPTACCHGCAHAVAEAMAAILNVRPFSDITAKRIERELRGPSISIDALYKDEDVRPHFYSMIDDVTRLSAALGVLFPTAKPQPQEGAIDRAIRYLELLKSARDTAVSFATTPLPEDRQRILDASRVPA